MAAPSSWHARMQVKLVSVFEVSNQHRRAAPMISSLPADVLALVGERIDDVHSWNAATRACKSLRAACCHENIWPRLLQGIATATLQRVHFNRDQDEEPDDDDDDEVDEVIIDNSPACVVAALERATSASARVILQTLWPLVDARRESNVRTGCRFELLPLAHDSIAALHTVSHHDPLTNTWLYGGAHAAISRTLQVYTAHEVLGVRLCHLVKRTPHASWEPSTRRLISECFETRLHVPRVMSTVNSVAMLSHAHRLSNCIMEGVRQKQQPPALQCVAHPATSPSVPAQPATPPLPAPPGPPLMTLAAAAAAAQQGIATSPAPSTPATLAPATDGAATPSAASPATALTATANPGASPSLVLHTPAHHVELEAAPSPMQPRQLQGVPEPYEVRMHPSIEPELMCSQRCTYCGGPFALLDMAQLPFPRAFDLCEEGQSPHTQPPPEQHPHAPHAHAGLH